MTAGELFVWAFGRVPEAIATAPGRVNMLGEHTDYNEGLVLPATIDRVTEVAVGRSPDGMTHVWSRNMGEEVARVSYVPGTAPPAGFGRYVYGCTAVLQAEGFAVAPSCMAIRSDVPIGAGLSSSAALEVAVLRALRARYALALDDKTLALHAQRAEIEFAGVNCGIMDQMAVSVGLPGAMLFLDTRSLQSRSVSFPRETEVSVFDCGVARTLATSGYNERRKECEAAAAALGVRALRDVQDVAAAGDLPERLRKRARHVITENQRVLEAAAGVAADRFGRLMSESHASLRDDFEVSIPALDALVQCLQQHPGVHGAKLTGAGFGGACVALIAAGARERVNAEVLEAFAGCGFRGRVLL